MLTVTIPLPPKELSPNYRSRTYHAKARATADYRHEAKVFGMMARAGRTLQGARITATFYCGPTKLKTLTGKDDRCRPTDGDNANACLKAAMDGLRDARLIADDTSAHVRLEPPILKRTKKEHQGRAEVVLEIEEWVGNTVEGAL